MSWPAGQIFQYLPISRFVQIHSIHKYSIFDWSLLFSSFFYSRSFCLCCSIWCPFSCVYISFSTDDIGTQYNFRFRTCTATLITHIVFALRFVAGVLLFQLLLRLFTLALTLIENASLFVFYMHFTLYRLCPLALCWVLCARISRFLISFLPVLWFKWVRFNWFVITK